MASRDNILIGLTPEVLLKAYACGIFPMAEDADDPALFWIDPPERGIIPLDGFHVPSRLARTVRSSMLTVVCDRDFSAVIDACAEPGPKRARTWINAPIRKLYQGLFEIGHCHTVEVYDGDALVGGLYGVSLGRAFFGESMFHRARDASKIALVHLVARLRLGGFDLLDTQFLTEHLAIFGATEVPQERYGRMLASAISQPADMTVFRRTLSGEEAIALARG
jgi:leucyl/phenylalanyl-tRNA--protein transferase